MTYKIYCDRCGNEIKENVFSLSTGGGAYYDLCESCYKRFKAWINGNCGCEKET